MKIGEISTGDEPKGRQLKRFIPKGLANLDMGEVSCHPILMLAGRHKNLGDLNQDRYLG